MLYLSEVIMQNHHLEHFDELIKVIEEKATSSGEIHFDMDVKPAYPDTPENWEDRLEGAFAGIHSVTR